MDRPEREALELKKEEAVEEHVRGTSLAVIDEDEDEECGVEGLR